MRKDYYKILGVNEDASETEIKKAFHKLAHKHHPDKGGDEKMFKDISEAYSVLSNKEKRAMYDGGGFTGNAGFQGFESAFGGQGVNFDPRDIFTMFSEGIRKHAMRGADVVIDLEISFKEAIFGGEKTINIPYRSKPTQAISISIPSNVLSISNLRIPGGGEKGKEDAPSGDLFVRLKVIPHNNFKIINGRLVYDIEIPISTAILGGEIKLKNLKDETFSISIPSNTKNGTEFHITQNSHPNFIAKVNLVIPNKLSKKAKEAVEILKNEGL